LEDRYMFRSFFIRCRQWLYMMVIIKQIKNLSISRYFRGSSNLQCPWRWYGQESTTKNLACVRSWIREIYYAQLLLIPPKYSVHCLILKYSKNERNNYFTLSQKLGEKTEALCPAMHKTEAWWKVSYGDVVMRKWRPCHEDILYGEWGKKLVFHWVFSACELNRDLP